MASQGGRANRRGRTLERAISELLDEEYQRVTPGRFFALRALRQPIYAAEVYIGSDIYNKRRRVDFLLYHPHRWPDNLVIQCKWQASRGSVEEKYPFEVLSIRRSEFKTIIVLDGGGYSQGAQLWLQSQAGEGKLLHVFNLGDINRYHSQGRL